MIRGLPLMYHGLRLGGARCYSLEAGAFIGETVQLPAGLPEKCPEIGETVQLPADLPEKCPEIGETVQLSAGLPEKSPKIGETLHLSEGLPSLNNFVCLLLRG